ncbi:MAG TPA: L,D-transpeptidase family protein [Mycobacteriales bacterium]|nr:L,D-transpeptidase family protein [Mycobacteriales bacterium]
MSAAVLAITGCSGSSSPSAGSAPGADPAAKPLKVVSVSPDTLSGTAPIVVTFRRDLASNSALPAISPPVPGQWVRNAKTATFTPTQSYPPSTRFTITLAQPGGLAKTIAQPQSQPGSIKFAEQILARLHYLPLDTKAVAPSDETAEAAAVYTPPVGKFTWRFADTPSSLEAAWVPGQPNTVLRGAVIAFQHQSHLKQDGAIGPATWKALQRADLAGEMNPDKYSYISADLFSRPQTLTVWIDGKTALSTPVNGGVPAAPTPLGTYPIYLRYTATTMQGTNPDGTKYKDKGVPWVNYFSGGSAVHGFTRASYGYPQSVGCLELPPDTAKRVYDLVDYGTLVTVTGPFIKPPKVGKPAPPPSDKPKHHTKPTASPTPTKTSSATPTPTPTPSRTRKAHR